MKVNSELKTAKTEYKEAVTTLQSEEARLKNLQEKLGNLQDRSATIEKALSLLRERKNKTLPEFAIGNATEAALKKISSEVGLAEKDLDQLSEMIQAVKNEIHKAEAEQSGPLALKRDRVRRLRRVVWAARLEQVKDNPPSGLQEWSESIHVAFENLRGAGARIELPFGVKVSPEMTRDRISEMTEDIEREFLS